ncbi:MAG: hypothetical protein IZT60_03620 [Gammaproteobacteria bacterium]|nr:hypothetical protein [Gammaproteobacteria bacterium]
MNTSLSNNLIRQQMLQILNAALHAVAPHRLVFEALQSEPQAEIALIAIGNSSVGRGDNGEAAAKSGQRRP